MMNRTEAPSYSQAQDLKIIFPEKIELQNGVNLYWLKDVKDDSVKVDIQWTAGTKYQDKKLVAGFTNKMLLSGSDSLLAKDISEEIDFYGGYSQTELDKDHAAVILYGLKDNISDIFNTFQKAFSQANFPASVFNKEVSISQDKFKVESQKVKVLCRRSFNSHLFGADSKYGQVAEIEDYDHLKREDLQAYFKAKYSKSPVIFLTGKVNNDFIEELRIWSSTFTGLDNEQVTQQFKQSAGRKYIEKDDALQSAIRIGRLMFDKNHPDYFKFQLLNTILGGYFGSRLMANIREDKGYTYGIGSGLSVLEDEGYFFITTEVGKDVSENAIDEVYKELDQLKGELISDQELTKVKNYMLGEFLRQADGPIAMMEIYKNIYFNKLKDSYYSDFIAAIHEASANDLRDLAKKYFNRSQMLEVVAG